MMPVNCKDMILLLQGALTLQVGSASHTITQERRWELGLESAPVLVPYQRTRMKIWIRWRRQPCLVVASWRGPRRGTEGSWEAGQSRQWTSTNANKPKTRMTSGVFWRRASLQDTAAGTTSARSHTPSSRRGERSRRANSQPNSCEGTIDSCTQLHNFLINVFFPIPGSSLLPMAGHLLLCFNKLQLVIQAVRGYKLELISAPYQEIPTKASGS